jgi:PHR domain
VRQLSYISDEEAFDAISFIPKKDILFAGFSVYHVASTDIDFKCTYKYKIGTEASSELVAEFSQADVEKKMCDIMLDQELPVSANKPITIMVRFQAGDEYFCSTLLGYGGENYKDNNENEEKDAFDIKETPDCTKGETDLKFG